MRPTIAGKSVPLLSSEVLAKGIATHGPMSPPKLCGRSVVLRDLRISDAPSLFALLTTEEVSRFISKPPATLEAFERFIHWTEEQQRRGTIVCFAVVPNGLSAATGIFQIRKLDSGFSTSEWGFAIGSAFWGTGIFVDAARLALDFAFTSLGVHRLEARAAVTNARGNAALRKLGAVQEGVLRKSLQRSGETLDQILWTILAEDWDPSKSYLHLVNVIPSSSSDELALPRIRGS